MCGVGRPTVRYKISKNEVLGAPPSSSVQSIDLPKIFNFFPLTDLQEEYSHKRVLHPANLKPLSFEIRSGQQGRTEPTEPI